MCKIFEYKYGGSKKKEKRVRMKVKREFSTSSEQATFIIEI